MNREPLVSIIIDNYNYGKFLSYAIDSALSQTYATTEIIVVDDGSTDNSREIIASYGNRIVAVLKENGGQGSAFNAGFAQSHGEVIIFLDSDDLLLPQTAERVAEALYANPNVTIVQYRLELIDMMGVRMGTVLPAAHIQMPSGDLRFRLTQFNNNTWRPPCSGNAFAAWALRRTLPMPDQVFGIADQYLQRVNALLGPIISLNEVGGEYRVHGSNFYNVSTVDVKRIRAEFDRMCVAHQHIKKFADSIGLDNYPGNLLAMPDVMFLSKRLVSRKLEPERHPFRGDSLLSLLWQGAHASLSRSDVPTRTRLLHILWFVVMIPAPPFLAQWLAEKAWYPETRGKLHTLFTILQAGRPRGC